MVILFTTYGIGNRLRTIASTYKICKETNHKLFVFWPIEDDLNASYDDLFEKNNLQIISIKCNRYLHNFLLYFFKYNRISKILKSLIINGDFILKNKEEKLFQYFQNNKFILIRTCYELNENYNLKDFKFNFKNIIQNSILFKNNLIENNYLIGVHIRRTDNVWSTENSPTNLFIDRIKEIEKERTDLLIYIASDDPTIKDEFINEFGNKIISQPITSYNRNNKTGIIDATIELYNLSICNIILGSYGSSFSQIASKIGQNRLYIISDEIIRESRLQLENINNIKIPQLTKREWFYYYLHFIQLYRK